MVVAEVPKIDLSHKRNSVRLVVAAMKQFEETRQYFSGGASTATETIGLCPSVLKGEGSARVRASETVCCLTGGCHGKRTGKNQGDGCTGSGS